jgi:hypothetical protein
MHRFRSSLALVILMASVPLMADGGKADGSLTANGKKVALTHAYARRHKSPFDKTKTVLEVLVTDKELSPEAQSDEFEFMRAQDQQQLSGFTATIDDDKAIISATVFSPNFKKMHQFSGVGMQKLDLKTMTATRVAGTIAMPKPDDFFEEKYQYNATFDVPVSKPAGPPAPPVLKGTPLPAGGGEPGKAYMTYLKLMAGSDMKAFLNAVTADRAKEASSDPDFKKMFPLIQAMQAKNIKVTSGAVDGNNATLLATGKDGDDVSNGKITMAKENGQWKVAREEWKTQHE